MEHLALEVFDLNGNDSKFVNLDEDASITIVDTNEIFASGDVWSYSFSVNTNKNIHIFGTAADLHGQRMHDIINHRKARIWAENIPMYIGYLKLDDNATVDRDGNVDVSFESGQKTFEERIEGIKAREVSVGDDVIIGVALNRKRVLTGDIVQCDFILNGLAPYVSKYDWLTGADTDIADNFFPTPITVHTPYAQRWPKLVKSHGKVYEEDWTEDSIDYTNVQTPYDAGHPFCNINICYQLKVKKEGEDEELVGRGYTVRLAHGKPTTYGGDNETRYNNAPNFYLLYFVDRLFHDLGIHIEENQALDVEDLKRVFMLNYGCFYHEIENEKDGYDSPDHLTPEEKKSRYGQYYMPIIDKRPSVSKPATENYLMWGWKNAQGIWGGEGPMGKILLRDVTITSYDNINTLSIGSVEGQFAGASRAYFEATLNLEKSNEEGQYGAYSSYLAYATGENYPNVDISEVINAMKSMFGIRLIFDRNYSTVRIVLLRNIFRSTTVNDIKCDVIGYEREENNTRGFRMTYGQGNEDTSFFYKGFDDMFRKATATWRDTTDKHDYSQWNLDAEYGFVKQQVSAMNKTCYVTPDTGDSFVTKIDEEEDVLFPSLFETAGFMDAEDGDCTGENTTFEEVQAGAIPVIMNDVNDTYASLFTGDLSAPASEKDFDKDHSFGTRVRTYGRLTTESLSYSRNDHPSAGYVFTGNITGKLDIYLQEGFEIRLMDNYGIGNSGTPFDDADIGLRFGIMRGSGSNSYVKVFDDPDDDENDTWDVEPGTGAVSHPDTCDCYGEEWDYDGSTVITTRAEAEDALQTLFPDSNAEFDNESGFITYAYITYVTDSEGIRHSFMLAYVRNKRYIVPNGGFYAYVDAMQNRPLADILQDDLDGYRLIIETESSTERRDTMIELCRKAYGGAWASDKVVIDNGVGSRYGRFSLKLRAEKPNPYFDMTLPSVISTKQQAAKAMTSLYRTADCNLLDRPKVSYATMRAAGWDCPGDGYATTYGVVYAVRYGDYTTHEILWTPIKQDGTVLTKAQLESYVSSFEGLKPNQIARHDTYHLILDIGTSEYRAEVLHQLQALYYAEEGEDADSVNIEPLRYLHITSSSLQRRGLMDKFYPDYSYFIRNARIVTQEVRMTLAQLMSIDKTERARVGDVVGFIRKSQFTISNKTGLGNVKLEIMYI